MGATTIQHSSNDEFSLGNDDHYNSIYITSCLYPQREVGRAHEMLHFHLQATFSNFMLIDE